MTSNLLDAAYAVAVDVNPDLTSHLDPELSTALPRLAGQFPGASEAALEDAYRRARGLIAAAIDLADTYRGPDNRHTGVLVSARTHGRRHVTHAVRLLGGPLVAA